MRFPAYQLGRRDAFTLIEVVLTIAILATLLTALLGLLALTSDNADELISRAEAQSLEDALGMRMRDPARFETNYQGLRGSLPLLSYTIRTDPAAAARADGTPAALPLVPGDRAGIDFQLAQIIRPVGDPEYGTDGPAIEGRVFLLRPYPLVPSPVTTYGWETETDQATIQPLLPADSSTVPQAGIPVEVQVYRIPPLDVTTLGGAATGTVAGERLAHRFRTVILR